MKYLITIIDSNMSNTVYYITGASESFFVSLPHNYNQNIKVNVLIKQGTYTILSDNVQNIQSNIHKIFDKMNQKDNLILLPILDDEYHKQSYERIKDEFENALDYCFKMLNMRAISYQQTVKVILLSKNYADFETQYLKEIPLRQKEKVDSIIKDEVTLQALSERKRQRQLLLSQTSGYALYSIIALICVLSYFIIIGLIFVRT